MRSFMMCNPHAVLFGEQSENNEMGGAYSTYGGEVYTGCWWGNVRERDHLEHPRVNRRIILSWTLMEWNVESRTGSMWLMI
jgi:hypothetical protein